jgi:DNA-binding transcriptional LysR family regulator
MDLLSALGVLVRVVETGSFSAVARERELSQAAVARQVSQLEEHFGVRLFHRTTRKLSLTDDGGMLLGLARPVLEGVDASSATPSWPLGVHMRPATPALPSGPALSWVLLLAACDHASGPNELACRRPRYGYTRDGARSARRSALRPRFF